MSAISDIRDKDYSKITNSEKCFLELWEQMGFETLAESAAAELAALRAERDKLMNLLISLEWEGGSEYNAEVCPKCKKEKRWNKHYPDCELAAAFKGDL